MVVDDENALKFTPASVYGSILGFINMWGNSINELFEIDNENAKEEMLAKLCYILEQKQNGPNVQRDRCMEVY